MFRRRKIRFVVLLIFLSMPLLFFCQDDDPDSYRQIKPKHSYSIDVWLPTGTANPAFRKLFQGIIRGGASYQFSLKNKLNFGLGANYGYFRTRKLSFATNQLNGGLNLTSAYVKLGYEVFYNERTGSEFSFKAGYSYLNFHSDSLEKQIGSSFTSEAVFLEPSFSFILTASTHTAYKWYVSYSFQGIGFNPARMGITDDLGYNPESFSVPTQYFSFGFTFTHYFRQRE